MSEQPFRRDERHHHGARRHDLGCARVVDGDRADLHVRLVGLQEGLAVPPGLVRGDPPAIRVPV